MKLELKTSFMELTLDMSEERICQVMEYAASVASAPKGILLQTKMTKEQAPSCTEEKEAAAQPPRSGKQSRVERMFGPRESWDSGAKREDQQARPEEDITMEDAVKGPEKPKRTGGYTGFLHLRCEACGKTKGMCAKKPLKEHRCTCGHETKVEKLKKVEFTCSCCGSKFVYRTNENCLGFTMECLSCKAPVDLMYSQREKKYKGGENA